MYGLKYSLCSRVVVLSEKRERKGGWVCAIHIVRTQSPLFTFGAMLSKGIAAVGDGA